MGHIFKMIQLIEHLATFNAAAALNSQSEQNAQSDPLSLGDNQSDQKRRNKYIEIRAKIINAKLESMNEEKAQKWAEMRAEIQHVNEIQSRSLGKKKLNNCKN